MEKQMIGIKLDSKIIKKIDEVAKKQNRNRSNWIETLIKKELAIK